MSASDFQLQTIGLLEKIAQSQKALEGRIEAMERMLSQFGTRPDSPSFPQFQQLPPEIRHRIWSLAIPTRVLRLAVRSDPPNTAPMLPPAIAGACREARAMAAQHGAFVSLTYHATNPKKLARTRRYWFDSRHDVLELAKWVVVEEDEPRGIKALVQTARHILAPRAEAEWFARLFENTAPLVKVSLKFDTCRVSCCSWDSGIVNGLFGSVNTIEIMDLEDAGDIARVKGILRDHWRCPFFCEFDLEGWAAARSDDRDEEWMRQLDGSWMSEVARGWVMAETSTTEASTEALKTDTQVATMDVEDERVRTALMAMPDVRLVRAYLRTDVHSTCR
ncbi:hypothetical protein EsH8_VI_000344 [Colletotrichum jinshuiense]